MTAYFVEQVLAAARKTQTDNERGAILKAKLADELERYHRNSCYPDALKLETAKAVSNIIEILIVFQ